MRHARRPALLLLLAVLLCGRAWPGHADTLAPKSGPKVKGRVVSETATEVVFNPYWSQNPEMTWEVLRLSRDQVKKVEIEPHPEPEFFRRLAARKPGDAADLKALYAWAKERKLKPHAEMALALTLAEVPGDPEALALVGGASKWATLKKGNALLDAELMKAVRAYIAEADPAARTKRGDELKAAGFAAKPEDLERLRRSALLPKGLHVDVPLSLHADRYPGALYTLLVPDSYDPALTWPLLIGLHGGGPDGKDMDEVVGSGDSAMNFYVQMAQQHGVIVACPNAIVAQWANKVNEDLVRDLVAEMRLLYNIDIDRIHLTGHSMGGYGTWDLGPRMAELFATIAPAAGQGSDVQPLIETRTPIFIYHSDDDFIPVASDRQAAQRLRDADADFIYTELPKQGHGYPESVRRELFDFFLPRRNFDPAKKDLWPRSSLWGKVSPDEKTYLGDPLALRSPTPAGLEQWLAWVRLGGGRARTAVAGLVDGKVAGAVEGLAKIVKDEKAAPFARAEAARGLGLLGDSTAASVLRRVLQAPAVRAESVLAMAAARALAALKDNDAGEALAHGVQAWSIYFESKLSGNTMRFSDWQRSVTTLTVLVESWTALGAKEAVSALERTVIAKVFEGNPKVDVSERVPQDPSQARTALAKAVGEAFAKAAAFDPKWEALLASLAGDSKAQSAARAARGR